MSQATATRPAPSTRHGAERIQITAMTCDIPVVAERRRSTVDDRAGERVCRPTGRSPRRESGAGPRRRASSARPDRAVATRSTTPTPALPAERGGKAAHSNTEAVFRRRRTVAALAVGAVLAGIVWVLAIVGAGYEDAATPASPAATQVVHVRSGESLTDVAARIAPDLPSVGVIARLRELNGLETAGLRVGQPLVAPAYR